jgi:membrane protein YdbS with pleckstrin-like domain/DNA-directed RNA polymerase subunit RPC12/RpoP
MDIHFNCPRCGQNLSVEERGAGMIVNCPSCKGQIEIPRGTAPQAPKLSVSTTRLTPQSAGVTGYIDKYLMPGENVIYRTRLHWAVFMPALVWFIFAICLFFTRNAAAATVGALLLMFAVFPLAITSLIARATSEFAVTNKRVLIKTGWIRRHSLETLLSKVEGIRVEQSLFGRMWDYGTIVVSGTGGSKEPFRRIASPMQFRREVQEQIGESGRLS